MIKSVLTLRTGNAWVHALSYHILAPHVIVDTPLIVKIFGIARCLGIDRETVCEHSGTGARGCRV
jgi:hypothetical protein